jgi:drug/metabolite transporter (DMT)-like permease
MDSKVHHIDIRLDAPKEHYRVKQMMMSPFLFSAFFAMLAAVFFVLSATRASPPARKTWRRIGIIFALVALVIFAVRAR